MILTMELTNDDRTKGAKCVITDIPDEQQGGNEAVLITFKQMKSDLLLEENYV